MNFLKYTIWGILWILLIFILCSLPGSKLPPKPFFNFDKIVHFFFYSVCVLLLFYGFSKQSQLFFIQKHYFLFSILFSTFYGVFIEFWQGKMLANRSFDKNDIWANSIGVAIGICIWILFLKKRMNLSDK